MVPSCSFFRLWSMRHLLSVLLILLTVAALGVSTVALQHTRELQASLEDTSKQQAEAGKLVAELSKQLSDEDKQLDDLKKKMGDTPAPASTTAAVDDAHLKELIRAELGTMRNFGGGGQGGRRMNFNDPAVVARQLQDTVGLSEAKANELAPLIQQAMTEIRPLFQQGASPDEIKAKVKEATADLEAKSAALLTPDEQAKFVAYIDQRSAMMTRGGRRRNNGQGAPPVPRPPEDATATTPATSATAPPTGEAAPPAAGAGSTTKPSF